MFLENYLPYLKSFTCIYTTSAKHANFVLVRVIYTRNNETGERFELFKYNTRRIHTYIYVYYTPKSKFSMYLTFISCNEISWHERIVIIEFAEWKFNRRNNDLVHVIITYDYILLNISHLFYPLHSTKY